MKKTQRILVTLLAASLLFAACPVNSFAAAAPSEDSIQSEETGYKYITIDGVRYKRLWSYTYNRWIDPEWTPA